MSTFIMVHTSLGMSTIGKQLARLVPDKREELDFCLAKWVEMRFLACLIPHKRIDYELNWSMIRKQLLHCNSDLMICRDLVDAPHHLNA